MQSSSALLVKESFSLLSSKDQLKSPQGNCVPWFVKEFQRLEETSRKLRKEQTFTVATQRNNQHKNRYPDVLPCDEYLVPVRCCDSDYSVYINASRISDIFPEEDRVYIATQAPLKHCIKEFWHLVIQEKANIIVMITRLVERGLRKCDVYWPEKESEVWNLGCIQLSLEKEDTIAEMFTIRRHIRVHHTTSDGQVENRLVYQFQYIGWPDHGIPTNENTFLYFLEQVEKYQMGKSLIVHCSAGIGRTGVFCAVNILRRYFSSDSFWQRVKVLVDKGANREQVAHLLMHIISETVHRLRKRRPGMIQTAQQFGFLLYCLSWNFDAP